MAKKRAYPESKHMLARIECVIDGLSAARNTLSNIKEVALQDVDERIRDRIAGMIGDALAQLDLASDAIGGENNE